MKWLCIVLVGILPSCAQYQAAREFVIEEAKDANDIAMDKAHQFLCGNTYRAEDDFKKRKKLDPRLFHMFCDREMPR